MSFLVRGVLAEYSTDVLGRLPNIVVFQFNPEQISRRLEIRPRTAATPLDPRQRLRAQASGPPTESFTLTAFFDAVYDIGGGGAGAVLPKLFGVGPQLAALEKMVYPLAGPLSKLIGAVVDAVGSALGLGGGTPATPVPQEQLPRILFIWGPLRVLPVEIRSMSFRETQYDAVLNPTRAEVEIELAVVQFSADSDDKLGKGALAYTNKMKDAQVAANLANVAKSVIDIIPF